MFTPATHAPGAVDGRSLRALIRIVAWALLLAGLAASGGCATSPFSKELTQKARSQPSFGSLRANPDGYKGSTVIVGGTIIKTVNLSDHTEIEVLQKQLDSGYEPKEIDTAGGRFLARCQGFFDPEIYKAGSEVTVAGEVEGKEERPVGEVSYIYPVISCQKVQLWYERRYTYDYPPYYGYGPYWHGWYGGAFIGPRVIVVKPQHKKR
ncbi:MAG TPA: Slp family lipoprotein [Methylococcaceae bacterium]|nr:Slp family lipoprotein [Methylococcaceae bacterium]